MMDDEGDDFSSEEEEEDGEHSGGDTIFTMEDFTATVMPWL